MTSAIEWAERGWIPDWAVRIGIRRLLAQRLREEMARGPADACVAAFAQTLRAGPFAVATDDANAQHYEVPARFFEAALGPRLKYSCAAYDAPTTTLAEAEEAMLRLTCQRAELEDGMDVLDLGCGWGSLTLWIAEHYPHSRVTGLSNSHGQRRFIEARAAARGLRNVRIVTANLAHHASDERYDRVVSVEMFEHLRNYETLFARVAQWLRPGGRLFAHVFCHRDRAYPFETAGESDWMARHFFTGGIMPSFDLLGRFDRHLSVVREWRVNGLHYARTCDDWLRNVDAKRAELTRLFAQAGDGVDPRVRLQRWRIFFMACAELFRYRQGTEWFVGHYLFAPRAAESERELTPVGPGAKA